MLARVALEPSHAQRVDNDVRRDVANPDLVGLGHGELAVVAKLGEIGNL